MSVSTVASHFAGGMAALAPDLASGVLSQAWPDQEQDVSAKISAGMVSMERGERYAISRGMAIVPVRGLITPNSDILEYYLGWTTSHGLARSMTELRANDEVGAIVLLCDSPGGMVMGLQSAVDAVREAASVKPVHAFVHPLAASAAYHIASQARDISITAGSMVGSIGVMSQIAYPVQPGSSGSQLFIQTSSHARAKLPDVRDEAGRALRQERIDAMEARFHADVAKGRGLSVEQLRANTSLTDDARDGGAAFEATEAVERGLADRVETEGAFWDRMAAAYAPRAPRSRGRSAQAQAEAALALSRA